MIGVFDSGLGGLTTVKAIMQKLPGYNILYYGDTAHMPYGSKSPEAIQKHALKNAAFLIERGAKIIVIACNSAASSAFDLIKNSFDIPVFEVISPAIEAALMIKGKRRIGVIGTRATINSGIYEDKIKALCPEALVYSQACPLLVPLVEEGWIKGPETRRIIKKYLLPLKSKQIQSLILGCTHYPILKDTIQQKAGRRVNIIDSSICVADTIADYLEREKGRDALLGKEDRQDFFVSDITEQFKINAQKLLKKKIELKLVKI